jgi:hypothetical protein
MPRPLGPDSRERAKEVVDLIVIDDSLVAIALPQDRVMNLND